MAIMKIIAIRDRLDKRVNYVADRQKTALDAGVAYAANPEKTEQTFFTSAIQCRSPETAAGGKPAVSWAITSFSPLPPAR